MKPNFLSNISTFPLLKKIFFSFLLLTFVLALAFSLPLIFGFGKTGKNTLVLNRDYSLLTKKEIVSRLQSDFPLPETLTLRYNNRSFPLKLSDISAGYDYDHMASELLFRRLKSGLYKYFLAFFQPKNFTLEVRYDSAALDSQLSKVAEQIDRPFVPSQLALDDKSKQVVLKSGELGQRVNQVELKNQIISALNYFQASDAINLPLDSEGALPTLDQVAAAKTAAATLVGKQLLFTAAEEAVTLDDKTLISWLDFSQTCRAPAIADYVSNLKNSLKKDPVEAVFKFENGKVLEFRPSQNGFVLDESTIPSQICLQLTKLISSPEKSLSDKFPVVLLEPQTKNSDVNNLGIKELLGRGVSTFKHSSAIRNINVERGASIVNRLLVAPGETFSFIKALGDVSVENGYKMAYVIRAGKTELDVGGGICQVSTTFFRALLNAGLDITQRQNHAYRVQYYEEDMPPGYDATVFIPSPDLKFINDTGHHLLIQSQYDGAKKSLTYEIYGTSDGRQVEISNYRQWGAAPPPPAVYIDDPTLPPGKVIQDEHAIPGLKTSFDWKVTRQGEVVHQKTFSSSYTPWAAVFRRGLQQ